MATELHNREIRTFSPDADRVRQRREEIVQCASRLFIKRGYDRTSMRELAAAFGTSKAGMYHYIGSKEDILYLILDFNTSNQVRLFEGIREVTAGMPPREALSVAIRDMLMHVDEYQHMYILISHVMPNLDRASRKTQFQASDNLVTFYEDILRNGMNTGAFRAMEDPHLVAFQIVSLCLAWANRRWQLGKSYSVESYARKVTDLIDVQVSLTVSACVAETTD